MMKKLFAAIAVIGLLCLSAPASQHVSLSFLNVPSCTVSNVMGITNLNSTVVTSNKVGTTYVNLQGTTVTAAAGDYTQIIGDVTLPDTYGLASTASAVLGITNQVIGNIFIDIVAGAGANTAANFIFVPLPDGVTESTVAGDALAIAVTSAGVTPVQLLTPIYNKWPGVKKLRLKSVTHPDADADSAVNLRKCQFNTFIP